MKKLLSTLIACVLGLVPASAVTIVPLPDGIHITGDSDQLKFTITYPVLLSGDQKTSYQSKQADVKDNSVTLTYEGNGQMTVTIDPTGEIELKGLNLPDTIKFVRLNMLINLDFKNGGQFQAGAAAAKPFPADKPAQPHLFQGNAETMILRSGDGKGITITVPQYSYQDLADNRVWGTDSFQWMGLANYTGSDSKLVYKISDAPATAATP
jgi:hypothetical protein